MKKFLISLMLMFVVTVYTKSGKIFSQPWVLTNSDGVYLMTDKQADAGTVTIIEGATRILDNKGVLEETHQHIKVVPKMWSVFVSHHNLDFIARGNKENKK